MNHIRRASFGLIAVVAASASCFETTARSQGFGVNSGTPTKPAPTNAAVGELPSTTQFGAVSNGRGPQLAKDLVQQYQIGMKVTAKGAACQAIYATAPVPINWPEQTVTIISEEMTPTVKATEYRTLGGTVKQMLVSMPYIPPGDEASAIVTLEIRRFSQTPPTDTSVYVLANDKKLPKEMRVYLLPSPMIESNHTKIRAAAKEIATEHADSNAWQRVEAIYDWTREKVEYKKGPLKGAIRSLADGNGDCEELSSLFIAVCRASNIPARIVWVPDHCYPEFYLEDKEGKGYWFPCQAAGTREFGGITEHRPILQKGDNFQVPEKPKDRQRYVAEYLTGKGGNPKVEWIRKQLGSVE